MQKMKGLLVVLLVVAVVVAYFVIGNNAVVFEDTNGPDDMSLAILTEEDILSRGAGMAVSGPRTKEHKGTFLGLDMTSGTKYDQDAFSGVYVVEEWDFLLASDLFFTLYDFEVTGGNFRMCVVSEDAILADLQPGELCEFRMDDLPRGKYALVIAGESAAFSFTSFDFEEDI